MSVPKLTTPTFTLEFPETASIDLTDADSVYVTFAYGGEILTKTGEALTVAEKSVSVYLTQAETQQFPVGDVEIQVNWLADGNRFASEIVTYPISENLMNRVITSD